MNAKAEFEIPRICFDRIIPDELRSRAGMAEKVMLETVMTHLDIQHPIEILKDLDASKPMDALRISTN